MNQYPPAQDPWGQPADPQQNPQSPQYPQNPPQNPQQYPQQPEPQYAPPAQPGYDPQQYPQQHPPQYPQQGGYDPQQYPQQGAYDPQQQYAPAAQPYDPYGQQQAQYAAPAQQYALPQQGQYAPQAPAYAPPGYGTGYPTPGYPTPGYPGYGVQQQQPGNPQQRRYFKIGAVVAAVLAVLVVLHPLGNAGFGGTWVGPVTQQAQQGATIPVAELLMDLTQSSNDITGTGQECFNTSNGSVSENFDVTGTANGSSAQLTLKFSNGDQPVSGSLSGGTLTLTAQGQSGTSTIRMQQGTLTELTQACARLIKIDQTGG